MTPKWDGVYRCEDHPAGTHSTIEEAEACIQGESPTVSEPRTEDALPFDDRPCQTDCCDNQRGRHIHEGTHEDHVGDGGWCIDCDVVIGEAGENRSSPAVGLDPERLARVFLTLAAKHTGLEESDYNEEDMAYFRQEAQETAAEYDRLSRSVGVAGHTEERA